MAISFSSSGSFDRTEKALRTMKDLQLSKLLESEAQKGVQALSEATPQDTGKAALSWDYEIVRTGKSVAIHWTNTNVEDGYPVALMIQMGHGTGTGGYIQGTDFINPAMRPVFDDIARRVWKAVSSA